MDEIIFVCFCNSYGAISNIWRLHEFDQVKSTSASKYVIVVEYQCLPSKIIAFHGSQFLASCNHKCCRKYNLLCYYYMIYDIAFLEARYDL